jgi:hypothetical protein
MMASLRTSATSSGVISGSGLAMAKMIGLSAIDFTISLVTAPLTESPKNTSAPASACASVRADVRTAAAPTSTGSCRRCGPGRLRPWCREMMLSGVKPIALSSSRQAMPAAPAPLHTSLVDLMSRPVRSSALISPAAAMMAVPCWSSWNTGMSSSSRSLRSMVKHSGALMSSRLMPPQLLPRSLTQLMISSGSPRTRPRGRWSRCRRSA